MKKAYNICFTLVLAITLISCSKGEKMLKLEPELPEPEIANVAHVSNDSKSGGIYKGVLVGTTGGGSAIVILQANTATATIFFSGSSTSLTTNIGSWVSGQAMKDVVFSGGGMTLIFSVNADGSNPVVKITIPTQTVTTTVIKETSVNKVQVFEGTYRGNGGQSGILNFTVSGNIMQGVGKGNFRDADGIDHVVHTSLSGTRTGNEISGMFLEIGTGGHFKGTIDGENASGSFEQKIGTADQVLVDTKGTWTAKQTRVN